MATGYSHQIPGTADSRRASTLSMIRIDVIQSDIELRNYPEEEKYLFFFFFPFFSLVCCYETMATLIGLLRLAQPK